MGNYSKSTSAMNLAYKSMDFFITEYRPAPERPNRAFEFDGANSEFCSITDILFILLITDLKIFGVEITFGRLVMKTSKAYYFL